MSARNELAHYTREQTVELLRDGLAIIDELQIPEELRPIAYRKAVELLAAKTITTTQASPVPLDLGALTGRRH